MDRSSTPVARKQHAAPAQRRGWPRSHATRIHARSCGAVCGGTSAAIPLVAAALFASACAASEQPPELAGDVTEVGGGISVRFDLGDAGALAVHARYPVDVQRRLSGLRRDRPRQRPASHRRAQPRAARITSTATRTPARRPASPARTATAGSATSAIAATRQPARAARRSISTSTTADGASPASTPRACAARSPVRHAARRTWSVHSWPLRSRRSTRA
jgi:hypothetical protein